MRANETAQSDFVSRPAGGEMSAVVPELFRRLARIGLYTLCLTLVLFFALPRFGHVAWRGEVVHPQHAVGFTDEVALGELGEIIESREEVMRVRFRRNPDDTPRPLKSAVYLRGALLMSYRDGQWYAGKPSLDFGAEPLLRPRYFPPGGVMRQEYTIEGLDRDELFFVAPYVAIDDNPLITVDHPRQRLHRADYLRARRFQYTLGTTAIVEGVQKSLTPARPDDNFRGALAMPSGEGSVGLPNLRELAKKWIAESGLSRKDRPGRARFLEGKLAASGRFQYSLAEQQRAPNLDPIEDFLSNNPQGHCEYFATALALMLRSRGIPARMVSGYKCDSWDATGGYYRVRQLHAHTWVEAYLPPNQLPSEQMHGGDYWGWDETGGWLRLDPTPPGAGGETVDWLSPVRGGMDWLESLWLNYVVELDCQRQRDAIYKPIAATVQRAWREATDPNRWRAVFNSLAVALYLDHLGREARWILLGVLGLALAALLAGCGWAARRLLRRLYPVWAGNHSARTRRRIGRVEFYRRFETLLARRGIVRAAGQTQREFAAAAGAELASLAGGQRPARGPAVVAEAFYRVRFGRRPLDNAQSQAVERAIGEIAACRKSKNR